MSDSLLLDTDVVSFLFKKSARAEAFQPLIEGKRLALSFVSIAELFKWAIKRNWAQPRISRLENALSRYITIPYDRDWPGLGRELLLLARTPASPFPSRMPGSRPAHCGTTCHC